MSSVTIIYPNDPTSAKVGGVETFLRGFVKYAPADLPLKYVGISSEPDKYPPGRWHTLQSGGKTFPFYPVLAEKDENKKSIIPLSLRFTWRLMARPVDVAGSVLLFDRIEPVIAFRKCRQPKIGIIHNDIESQIATQKSEVLWSRFPQAYFLIEKRIFSYLDAVYTVNEKTLEFYRGRYASQASKFVFLPTWVDPEVFSPPAEDKAALKRRLARASGVRLPEAGPWVLFVGRIQEQKAPVRLVDTFAELLRRNAKAVLVVIGEGNLKDKMKRAVDDKGIGAHVFFLGNMRQEELAGYYRASDALLLTSNFEGMPRCTLEALGSGLPVVSTRVGEVARVVHNGISGEIVGDASPLPLSAALQKVLERPDVYSTANCLESVAEYHPEKVLSPLYEKIRVLGT